MFLIHFYVTLLWNELLEGRNHVMTLKELKLFMKAMDMHSFEYGAPDEEVFGCFKEVIDLEDQS